MAPNSERLALSLSLSPPLLYPFLPATYSNSTKKNVTLKSKNGRKIFFLKSSRGNKKKNMRNAANVATLFLC